MQWRGVSVFGLVILVASGFNALAAPPSWAGEYRNENLLNGQAIFQFSIQQSGKAIRIAFDAAYNDGHGAAPDGEGQGKIAGTNALEFKWEDSCKNSGTGMIKRAGDGIIVSMKTTRAVNPRCLVFYGQNMSLQRAK
jgi:hypothetical protein